MGLLTGKQARDVVEDRELRVALDIGSSKLRIIAGYVDMQKTVEVAGYMEAPSRGVGKGAVTDIDELASAIAELLRGFSEKYKLQYDRLTLGVPSCFIASENKDGTATVQSGVVTEQDRDAAIKNAKARMSINENNFKIIHIIPQNYKTDTSNEIYNPIGQYAKHIEVTVHLIGIKLSHIKNLESVLGRVSAELSIDSEINNDNAASDAVLTEAEKEIGVCHINIGKGTVGVSVYDKKCRILSFGFNDGGVYIDDDIARTYGISMYAAESLKIGYGRAMVECLTQDEQVYTIEVQLEESYDRRADGRGGAAPSCVIIRLPQLTNLIQLHLTNIFRTVANILEDFRQKPGHKTYLGAGFVITGGIANIPGIDLELKSVMFNESERTEPFGNKKVRIGVPRSVRLSYKEGTPGEMTQPDKAVIIGLLRCADDSRESLLEQKKARDNARNQGLFRNLGHKIMDWFDREL